jgi:nucleotide-binding universal stress UspA family protein
MGPIVCATRGGEASRRTQERAIALATERNAELTFLCVVDPGFAGPVDEELALALADELRRLGRSLLCIAQARARERGVEAQTHIRCGPIRQSIKEYLREVNASTLVIGSPKTDTKQQAFDSEGVHNFAQAVHEATDVEVVVVHS